MPDRIITAEAAQTLQDEADQDRELLTWVVMEAENSTEVMARPVTTGRGALPCVLVAATLAELHGMMPVGLTRSHGSRPTRLASSRCGTRRGDCP